MKRQAQTPDLRGAQPVHYIAPIFYVRVGEELLWWQEVRG